MKRSLNEIEVMVLKAARGAGIPLGQSQDLSQAARQGIAALNELPQAEINPRTDLFLTALMNTLHAGGQLPATKPTSKGVLLVNGASTNAMCAAVDLILASQTPVTLHQPETLIFLTLIALAEHNHATGIRWHWTNKEQTDISMSGAGGSPQSQLSVFIGAPEIPEFIWNQLSDFAANTYVPDTVQSRLSGAGAGLTDND